MRRLGFEIRRPGTATRGRVEWLVVVADEFEMATLPIEQRKAALLAANLDAYVAAWVAEVVRREDAFRDAVPGEISVYEDEDGVKRRIHVPWEALR